MCNKKALILYSLMHILQMLVIGYSPTITWQSRVDWLCYQL